jgi:hypothetical protein
VLRLEVLLVRLRVGHHGLRNKKGGHVTSGTDVMIFDEFFSAKIFLKS